ncbi:uncharacterized protein LOC120625446 [Pararge aegeria]|uniref:uncharacterized protein LOC120625446 n=1 Tax=Pararge aegeria TaxID=116150 RepID=UPI0019D013E3|nr:uncharacterized protein LOC120625446 [Pararge aegeria]
MEPKKHIRSTKSQIRYLLNYMATHKTFANSKSPLSPLEASKKAKEWSVLRALLRKHGPDKSVEQWKTTWRDLKRNRRKWKLEGIETFDESTEVVDCDTLIEDLKPRTEHKFSTEFVDPQESSNAGGVVIKEEPSTYHDGFSSNEVNLEIPCSSPMQLILTNTESFTSHSLASPLYSVHNAPIANSSAFCDNSANSSNCFQNPSRPSCSHTFSNPPPICANGKLSANKTIHCQSQCCHQNTLLEASTGNLQAQQNVLLQNLCNLLEEQNSILRMRNRIERSKIRCQKHL